MTILFIVESYSKTKSISKILGKNYIVTACGGHFRDLDKNTMSIDFDNNFNPIYVVTDSKTVSQLKAKMKQCSEVYLASDLDREGEAISQHLFDVLKPPSYKRVTFNAINKSAINDAINRASKINKNLVNAQKARRVLDRIYGYMISPLLSLALGGKLSAGRVQSVALKIIVDKENEINEFVKNNDDCSHFRITATLDTFKCTTQPPTISTEDDALIFLEKCSRSIFTVRSVEYKVTYRNPPPPFETSTLQQEANRKLGMSVATTMKVAQKLYEGGFITYMRTDSVEISDQGHADIKKAVLSEYGKKFYQKTDYENKSSNAQEAHEAIRPTYPDVLDVDEAQQNKLYKLIWQRAIASQMKPASIGITTIQIDISKTKKYYFQSIIQKILFLGFMKVYDEGDEEDNKEAPEEGAILPLIEAKAKQEYLKAPPRYTEASLVGMLKKLEIGRPGTVANIFDTLTKREYVTNGTVAGVKKDVVCLTLKKRIRRTCSECILGAEKKKIIPTKLGIKVSGYLEEKFPEILDYKFTSKMEAHLDDISNGKKVWHDVVKKYYEKIKPMVQTVQKAVNAVNPVNAVNAVNAETLLGIHDDAEIHLYKSKYGYFLKRIGEISTNAKIPPEMDPAKLTLAAAIEIFEKLDSSVISTRTIKIGRTNVPIKIINGTYGPYIRATRGKKVSTHNIPRNLDPVKLTDEKIVELVKAPKRKSGSKKN